MLGLCVLARYSGCGCKLQNKQMFEPGIMILAKPILHHKPFVKPVTDSAKQPNDSLYQFKGYNSSILPTK